MHRIVVDAMGGDKSPDEIVKGAAEASLALKEAELILVGDAARIGRILPQVRHDGGRVRVHHARRPPRSRSPAWRRSPPTASRPSR